MKDLDIDGDTTLITPDEEDLVEIYLWVEHSGSHSAWVPFDHLEKWVASIRKEKLMKDMKGESHDDCAGCEHASDKPTYDCMAPSLTPCPPEQTKKGDY